MTRAALAAAIRVADRRFHLTALAALACLGGALYFPIFRILPLGSDNLYVLAWVDQASVSRLFELDPAIYPEWRPLAYQSIWLEHSLVQLNLVAVHHLVNLLLWVGCTWLVYRLVMELTASRASALAAAMLLLIDRRSIWSLVWIVERQSTLACGCGLAACLIVVRTRTPLSSRQMLAVVLLLLGSALGKEYGLAFAAAFVGYAALERRRDLAIAGLAVAAGYVALRLSFAPGAFGLYCENMGYFFESHPRCVSPLTGMGLPQMTYNLVANAIGTAIQGLLDNEGTIFLDPARLGLGLALFALAVWGVTAGDRRLRLLALVPVFNAVLGIMTYRHRNQLVGMSALAVAVGVGLSLASTWPAPTLHRRAFRGVALALLLGLASWHLATTHQRVEDEVSDLLRNDPCQSRLRQWPYADRFAKRVKEAYGLDDPHCRASPGS